METLEAACAGLGPVDGSTLTILATRSWTPDSLVDLGDRAPALLGLDATLRAHFARPRAALDRATQAALRGPAGEMVMTWAAGSGARRELWLADAIGCALGGKGATKTAARRALEARVLRGPRLDALRAATFVTRVGQLDARARARLDLLVWDLGASRETCADAGRWLLSSDDVLGHLVLERAHGSLRERILAARLLAIAGDGYTLDDAAARGARWRSAMRALMSHPEPRVWVPAAHAAGRLAPSSADVRAWLLSWLRSSSKLERRRAVTAIACAPDGCGIDVARELRPVLDDGDVWTVAALGPAAPVLAVEHRSVWDAFVSQLEAPDAPIEVLWSAAQGLVALRAAGDRRAAAIAGAALVRARDAKPKNESQAQCWIELTRDLELAETGRAEDLGVELALDRLVGTALDGDERVAFDRAARAAQQLPAAAAKTFASLRAGGDAIVLGRACATLDAVARSCAVALWEPLAALAGQASPDVALGEVVDAATQGIAEPATSFVAMRAGLRLVGHALDAQAPLDRGPAVAALFSALTEKARKKDSKGRGLELHEKAIGDALFRALEAVARPGASGLARLAAWATLAGHDDSILGPLGRADAAARTAGVASVEAAAAALRAALHPGAERALEGAWSGDVLARLDALESGGTRIAQACSLLGSVLRDSREALLEPSTTTIVPVVRDLGRVVSYLRALLADPVAALDEAGDLRAYVDAAGEVADVVERSIAQGERLGVDIEPLAMEWAAGLGPVLGPLVDGAVREVLRGLVRRQSSRPAETRLGRFRVVEVMHVHGMGEIWLVEDDGRTRYVAKLAKGALTGAAGPERERLLDALAGEVAAVFDLRHPNVARIHVADFGNDPPFVVMEYLIGASLEEWSEAGRPSIAELKPIVADVASGLRALHARGLVHRDMKPSNVYLRLDVTAPAEGRYRFEAADRARAIRQAVVIDFGIAHRTGGALDVFGTPGYVPPEQAMQKEPTVKADVYALAATIYSALVGHGFFADATNAAQYFHRHAFEPPLGLDGPFDGLDGQLLQLLRDATELEPTKRIGLDELARRFAGL